MRTELLYLFLLLANINIMSAQSTYDLFTAKGLKYGILYEDSYENGKISNHSTFYEGDTIIDGLLLIRHAMYAYSIKKHYLHINEKKVYYFDQGTQSLVLLYDFALKVNDTFNVNNGITYIVQKREIYTYGDGKARIYLQLKSKLNNSTLEWVEGIGDIHIGPFNLNYHHRYDLRFICSSHNDEIIFRNEESYHTCKESLFCKNAIAIFSKSDNAVNIIFDNNSINSIDQIWDFGDSTFSKELNPIHKFDSPGCKKISLKAISACGDTSITSRSINYCVKGDWEQDMYLDIKGSSSDVYFIDKQRLWVMTRNEILYSQNGGVNFNNISPNIEPNKTIKMLFFDGETGVALIESRLNFKRYYEVYATDDNGENWSVTNQGFGEFGTLYHNYDTNSFVFKLSSLTTSVAYISVDNGANWNNLPLPGFNINSSIDILDNSSLIFKYQNTINNQKQNYLAISKDFGFKWEVISTNGIKACFFFKENLSFFISNENEFLVSNDLLKTYTALYQFPSDFDPYQLQFLDINRGFINDGQYSFFTLDGGKTWVSCNCEKNDIEKLKVDHNNEIFAFDRNNNIYRFSLPAIDALCTNSSTINNDKNNDNLIISPNPSDGVFIIESLNSGSYKMFTEYGQLVNKGSIIKGKNPIHLDLIPGFYIIQVSYESSNQHSNIKVIIIK